MSTDCGSLGSSRTVTPPCAWVARTWNRVTGTVASSRSETSTPAALSPTMTARLSARPARLESREVVTTAPFFRVVP